MKKGLLSVLMVLVGAACVGPRYQRPAVVDDAMSWKNQTVLDTAIVRQPPLATAQRPDTFRLESQWWKLFKDDTLTALIETAFANNPTLKNAAYRIMEARALVGNARANYYPVVTLDPSINRNKLSADRPSQVSTGRLPALTLTTISVPLDMSYEFDVWGKFRRGVQATQASLLATEADHEVVKLGLATDIATNYFNLCLIDNQIQLFSNALKLRNANLNLTRSQYDAGLTTKLDVVQAEIEAATVEAQVIDSRRMRALTENAIALLCGVPAPQLKIGPHVVLPGVPFVPPEMPSDLLRRRPDIVEAEQQMVSSNALIGVAEAAFLPSVKLSAASAGFLSSQFQNLFSHQSETWIGGIGISIPLFTGGRNIAQKDIAVAHLKESQAAYQEIVQTAFREVQDAMANIDYRAQQSEVQLKALSAARATADMSKELYKKGLTTYINVIVADRDLLDAENTFITITGQRLLYTITLIKALGGGWGGPDDSRH
jgi:multidrug efflux system outer membrane protein